jgi:hypothetical protein
VRDLRLVGVLLLAVSRPAHADGPRFEPPSPVDAAHQLYARGKQLYAEKKFKAAGDEFAAAYAIDPDSKFLLFNIALARRMAGECREAVTAYRTFVATNPPADQATNAQIGIDRCEALLRESQPPPAPDPTEKPPVVTTSVVPPPPERKPEPVTVQPRPWYSDGVGDVLVASGSAALIASVVLQLSARSAARTTFHPASLADFEANRDSAATSEVISWIAAGAGVALIVGGVIHIRQYQRDGVAVTLGGTF